MMKKILKRSTMAIGAVTAAIILTLSAAAGYNCGAGTADNAGCLSEKTSDTIDKTVSAALEGCGEASDICVNGEVTCEYNVPEELKESVLNAAREAGCAVPAAECTSAENKESCEPQTDCAGNTENKSCEENKAACESKTITSDKIKAVLEKLQKDCGNVNITPEQICEIISGSCDKNNGDTDKNTAEPETAPEETAAPEETKAPEAPAAPAETEQNEQPEAATTLSEYEKEVVRLVNEIRAQYGLDKLTLNEKLSGVARAKSQDMHDKGYFSHTSPTYGSPFDMMKTFGITYRAAGENIAMGYQTPQSVVDGWMNSEGHRANILNSSFTEIGVGYVASGNYWTQMFIG